MLLTLILIAASILRLTDLSHLPISLFGDEVDVAYQAWSLWQTGRDYMGNLLPTYIQSLAEWRAPLIMYITAPFVGILGPSTFSTRLPVALLGISNIYLIYLLTNQLFPQKKLFLGKLDISIGHIAALFLTFTPWHIHYSRANFEVTLLLALLLLGAYWFVKYTENPKPPFTLFPIPLALTFYTYSTANLFTPLLAISLLIIYKPKLKKLLIDNWPIWLSTAVLMTPISYHLLFGQAAGRFQGISIFSSQDLIDQIVLARTQPWASQSLSVLFHNKVLKVLTVFFSQYLSPFSPQFLFISGDPYPRHSVLHFGQLLWVSIPFFLVGIYQTIKNTNKSTKLLLTWLLISPLPSALTQQGGMHATRLILLLPVLIIITAIGFIHLFQAISRQLLTKFFMAVFLLLLFINTGLYWHQYSTHYRHTMSRYWHYGYQDIFTQLKKHAPQAERVFINNTYEPALLRFAFYTQYSPKKFQDNLLSDASQENLFQGFDGFKLSDKYYFGQIQSDADLANFLHKGDIYLAAQGREVPGHWDWSKSPPEGLKTLHTTYDAFGDPLFHLVKLKND